MNGVKTPGKFTLEQTGAERYVVWKREGADARIWLSLNVVRRLREFFAASSNRDPGRELGGLLLGTKQRRGVRIDDFSLLHAAPSEVRTPELRALIEVVNLRGRGLSVVGYFRSDFRNGVCLYDEDLRLIQEYFANRSNVFLIVHPGTAPYPAAGFFLWENDSVFSSRSFMEFDFDESKLMSDAGPAAYVDENVSQGSAALDEASRVLGQARRKAAAIAAFCRSRSVGVFQPLQKVPLSQVAAFGRSRAVRVGLAPAAIFALGTYLLVAPGSIVKGLIFGARSAPRAAVHPSNVGLSVTRSGSEIRIAWNGDAPIVNGASGGTLTINEGQERRIVPLTPIDLRSSRLLYTPRSGKVEFTLEIFAENGKVARENVIALWDADAQTTPLAELVANRENVPVESAKPEVTRARTTSLAEAWGDRNQVPVEVAQPEVTSRKPARDFVPPPGAIRPIVDPRIEPPASPPIARGEAPPLDSVIIKQFGAPMAAPPELFVEKPPELPRTILQPTHQPPIPILTAAPVLPPSVRGMLARRTIVKVRVQVDATGKITAAEALDTNGSMGKFLGVAAVSAARLWRFEPARQARQKVPGELTVEFTFVPDRASF